MSSWLFRMWSGGPRPGRNHLSAAPPRVRMRSSSRGSSRLPVLRSSTTTVPAFLAVDRPSTSLTCQSERRQKIGTLGAALLSAPLFCMNSARPPVMQSRLTDRAALPMRVSFTGFSTPECEINISDWTTSENGFGSSNCTWLQYKRKSSTVALVLGV